MGGHMRRTPWIIGLIAPALIGVRAIARLVGVNRNTVIRYSRLAGPHARLLHDEFVAFSPSNPRDPVR